MEHRQLPRLPKLCQTGFGAVRLLQPVGLRTTVTSAPLVLRSLSQVEHGQLLWPPPPPRLGAIKFQRIGKAILPRRLSPQQQWHQLIRILLCCRIRSQLHNQSCCVDAFCWRLSS